VSNETPLATFEFRRGDLVGSHLSLFKACLVHRSAERFETIHLDRVGALGVAFERETGRIAWGCGLLFIAGLLIAIYFPLRMLIATTAGEVTAQLQGTFLPMALRALDFLASLLPFAGIALAVWGVAWLTLGVIGETVVRVVIAPVERVFASRGRDPLLFEFAESVAAQIAKRG
jgi:hypothetical protein